MKGRITEAKNKQTNKQMDNKNRKSQTQKEHDRHGET